jgi:hypothetical protein
MARWEAAPASASSFPSCPRLLIGTEKAERHRRLAGSSISQSMTVVGRGQVVGVRKPLRTYSVAEASKHRCRLAAHVREAIPKAAWVRSLNRQRVRPGSGLAFCRRNRGLSFWLLDDPFDEKKGLRPPRFPPGRAGLELVEGLGDQGRASCRPLPISLRLPTNVRHRDPNIVLRASTRAGVWPRPRSRCHTASSDCSLLPFATA